MSPADAAPEQAPTPTSSAGLPGRKLVLSAGVYILGTFLQRGLLFLSLPIYARLFGVEDYARWSLFVALAAVFGLIFDLAWSRGIPRLYFEYWDDIAVGREYLLVSFFQRVLLWLGLSVVFWIAAPVMLPLLSGGTVPYERFGASLLIAAGAECLLLFVCASFRARQRAVPFVSLKLAQALAQIGGSLAAVHWGHADVEKAASVFAAGSALVAVAGIAAFLRSVAHRTRGTIRFGSSFRSNAAFSFPLVFHDLASWLRNAADPFIIAHFLTLYAVSIYHVGYQFGLIIGLLLYSVELALSPFLFQLMKSDPDFRVKYMELTHAIVGCTFALVVTTILFSREAIALLFPSTLAESARIAPLVAAGYFFHGLYTVYVKPFVFLGRTELIPLLTTGPTILGVVLSIVFTPSFGVLAPAVLTIVSLAVLAGVVYLGAQRLDAFPYPLGIHLAMATTVVLLGVACSHFWELATAPVVATKILVWGVLLLVAYRVLLRGGVTRVRALLAAQPTDAEVRLARLDESAP
jgi:O-antigen/teichoic acid export membrane protein